MGFDPQRFSDAVMSLCPGVQPRSDFIVANDGTGPKIVAWNRTDVTQPTQDAIVAVDTDALPGQVAPITRRQLVLVLAQNGYITEDEAVAAASTGAVPSILAAYVATLAPADQVKAKINWASQERICRLDPTVAALAAAHDLTNAQVDAMFIAAAGM